MILEARIEELRARLQLAQGSATLLLAIAESDAALDEARRVLIEILRATPMSIADLGPCAIDTGPARWAELTQGRAADAFALVFKPSTPLAAAAFARLLNAERELLRQLAGPVVLVVSRATEKALRQQAPDFFTWVAQGYELPEPRDLLAIAAKLGVAPVSAAPKPSPEEPIRFLHISDLHLRPQRVKRYDQDRVLDGLITFLERDRASSPLDLVFVTGDLAQSGRPEEYTLVVELLQKLMDVTSVPAERVFVIPGNHDVDREVGRWLLRTLTKDEDAIAFFEEAKNRVFHEQKLAAYRQSMSSLLGATRSLGLGVGEQAVETVTLKGARLAVASFNTAWFAQGDDDHGKLWIGEPDVERAVDRIADEEADFAIALLHHPFDYLNEIERDVVERWFERSFDLVLRGHLHANKTRSIASQRGGFIEVAGPAAYQGSQWPNGCFLGEIRARARAVRLRPYLYASGPDPWVLDSKVFPDDEKDGYCRTFTVPEKKRLKSAVTRPLREAAEAAVKAASPAEQQEIARQLGSGGGLSLPRHTPPQQMVGATRSLAETPELWTEILGKESWGHALANDLVTEIEANQSRKGRIALTDERAFEEALLQAGQMFLKVTSKLGLRGRLSEHTANVGLAAALRAIVEEPVSVETVLFARGRSDILIGRVGASTTGDIIEVKRVVGRAGLQRVTQRGLSQLDVYFPYLGPAARAALVLLDALSPDALEPQIEHEKTSAGRDVLLLRL